jgi:hypothetical protein
MPLERLRRILLGPSPEDEDQRRRFSVVLFIFVVGPVFAAYSLVDIVEGRPREGVPGMVLAALFLGAAPLLRKRGGTAMFFRVAALASLLVLFHEVSIGAGNGHAFLWFYIFPVVAFTATGPREGLAWVLGSILAISVVFALGSTIYAADVVVRLLVTYALISLLTLGLETSRRHYQMELQRERDALADALAQVRRLRGLLPICCSCKRIRDDRGYWTILETYIRDHADVDFSHGLCPECRAKLYPEMEDEPGDAVSGQ